ncbi:hypothetical protein AAFN46_15430 [Pseudomonas sp. CAU 1711]|uniref:hypothetical protein n=1 Tax=Pseudomonas sp. CAU 1711 TaxID=3140356 RepID=UPI00326084DF
MFAERLGVEPQALRFGNDAVNQRGSGRAWKTPAHYQDRATIEAFLALPVAQRKKHSGVRQGRR